MLTDKIRLSGPGAESDDVEDIFSSSLATIFPDDITNQHGDATSSVIYLAGPSLFALQPLTTPSSSSNTDSSEQKNTFPIYLSLADPSTTNVRLFSHFLWNASLQLSEFIEEEIDNQSRIWDVRKQRVLELGAGTGLAGIIASLKGAKEVVVSDYPAPEVLANIESNIERNVTKREDPLPVENSSRIGEITAKGHEWGVLTDSFSVDNKATFSRILVADCLWMPHQHLNLASSVYHFLAPGGKAWVIAGFHTGRQGMRGFFDEEMLKTVGLVVESIWERNAEGEERGWVFDRGVEDVTERKRWLVCGILGRKDDV